MTLHTATTETKTTAKASAFILQKTGGEKGVAVQQVKDNFFSEPVTTGIRRNPFSNFLAKHSQNLPHLLSKHG